MEHGAHLGILGDNPFLVLAAIFLLGCLVIARLAALPADTADQAAADGASTPDQDNALDSPGSR